MNNMFVPYELKTLTIDTEKKIFKINGEDFGNSCTGFTISCDGPGLFDLRIDLETVVRYVHYEGNKIVSDKQGVPHTGVWTDNLKKSSDQLGDTFDQPGE